MEKQKAVQAALRLWARTPFVWGKSDCMLSVADYLVDVVGADCGGRFRGKYASRRGCMRVSGFHRDPVRPFADCVAEIPLLETKSPKHGDVGVVEIGGVAVGGLCLGDRWAARGDEGVIITKSFKVLKAWAV